MGSFSGIVAITKAAAAALSGRRHVITLQLQTVNGPLVTVAAE
jgi:hypothetical protein